MATSSGPRDINDLLTSTSRTQPPRPPQASPPSVPDLPVPTKAETAPATRKGTFILTEANDDALHRLSYYTPGLKGEKSYLVNKALEAYLAQFPDSQRPIPEGEDIRRRGRRHH